MDRLDDAQSRRAEIVGVDLSHAWFRNVNLRGAHIRGADLTGTDIDGEIDGLTVHGVEVAPLVEAELDRRHPERAVLRATDADSFRSGWPALEQMWSSTMRRAAEMPERTVDVSINGEWSFSQTLRHLVFATDVWLGDAILRRPRPYHPYGEPYSGWRDRASEVGIELDRSVPYAEVLAMRADRVGMVRDYLASVTDDELDDGGREPFFEPQQFTVRDCLTFIVTEEWHHHRYAVRDLQAIAAHRSRET